MVFLEIKKQLFSKDNFQDIRKQQTGSNPNLSILLKKNLSLKAEQNTSVNGP